WRQLNVQANAKAVPASVDFAMPVRRVVANANLKEDAGKTAIMRGPIVYALEGEDNGGKVLDVTLPASAQFTAVPQKDLLGGVTTLTTKVGERTITAVPYFAWANRGRGEMVVWIK
ncbi:MAG: glycoside hydrolase family 127 protein, partial [Acidobacteriota bacterium]